MSLRYLALRKIRVLPTFVCFVFGLLCVLFAVVRCFRNDSPAACVSMGSNLQASETVVNELVVCLSIVVPWFEKDTKQYEKDTKSVANTLTAHRTHSRLRKRGDDGWIENRKERIGEEKSV